MKLKHKTGVLHRLSQRALVIVNYILSNMIFEISRIAPSRGQRALSS